MKVLLKKRISTKFFDLDRGIYNATKQNKRYMVEAGNSVIVIVCAKNIKELYLNDPCIEYSNLGDK